MLQDLHEDHQFLIAARARPVMVAPGHDICVEGSPADCIWLMHTGTVAALIAQQAALTNCGAASAMFLCLPDLKKSTTCMDYTKSWAQAKQQTHHYPHS